MNISTILLVVVLMFVLYIFNRFYKQWRHDRWWKWYNGKLNEYQNDPVAMEKFHDRLYGNTKKQRDSALDLQENQNDLVYRSIKKRS